MVSLPGPLKENAWRVVFFLSALVVFAFVIILGAQGFARYCLALATCYAVAFLLTPTCLMVAESGRRPGADAS